MQKNILKCNVPILWLDTSIIIKMALWKLSLPLSNIDKERVSELYEIIYQLVRKKKLLCPFGGQEEEIWIGDKPCKDISVSLSLGIDFKHRLSIEDLLIQRFMKAFINKNEEVAISYLDAFHRDPIAELNNIGKFIFTANTGRVETIEKYKSRMTKICEGFESIRQEAQKNKETFEQRLQKEYNGYMEGNVQLGVTLWAKIKMGRIPTADDILGSITFGKHLACWKDYGGDPSGLEGLVKFYTSDIFKEIPSLEISCKLLAKIIMSSVNIESGDSMDTQLISAYLPYCDIMIIDRKMKNRIKELGLDKGYRTIVYALEDFEELRNLLLKNIN